MKPLINLLLFIVWFGWPIMSQAQTQPLPKFLVSRRANALYMDSLSQLAKHRYYTLTRLPQNDITDTLRLETLYYLGRLYKWWNSRRDSTLHFSSVLISQAHQSHNLLYEANGKLLLEDYYRNGRVDTPRALRINLEILALIPKAAFYNRVRLRVYISMGDLYSLSKEYAQAVRYLTLAHNLLVKASIYPNAATTNLFRAEVEQHLGAVFKQQNNFTESEKHYLAAERLLMNSSSETDYAFIYDDLGELYLDYQQYDKALEYAKKAESIWDRIKTPDESHSWGILSCVYAGLGQDELAFMYARKVLQLPKPTKFVKEQAYMALYQVYDHWQDWKNSALYYKKYVAVRDTITDEQRILELTAIQKQAEFNRLTLEKQTELERLTLQSKQAQQLQTQRLLTVEKQAELNQLRANARTDAVTQRALLTEQQGLAERARAQTALTRQKAEQHLQQQTFMQQIEVQTRTRVGLIAGLIGVLLFTLALGIVYGKNRAQQRQITQLNAGLEQIVQTRTAELLDANAELQQKNQAIREVDARIIAAQEAERQRIAADLHDDLGGTLATLRRRLSDLRQHLLQPEVIRQFDALQPLIQKSSADLRRIAHNLMPPEFTRIGLRAALRQLVSSQPAQPTQFSFITMGTDYRLPLETELNLYRIVSELIQNINKHAQANRAAVQLLYHNDRLTITVEDDGIGTRSLKSPDGHIGIGLKNSSLRAEYIGAKLWQEVSEGGTLLVLDVPYATPPNAGRRPDPNPVD